MGFKKLKRDFRYWIGWVLYNIFEWISTYLPLGFIYSCSEKLGIFAYYVHKGYRDQIVSNLNFAFGHEKSEDEIKGIAKDVGKNLIKLSFEMLHITALPAEEIKGIISLKGKENLDSALAKGKGVIGVSAHLGNFPIMGPKLAGEGYRFNILTKELIEPRIEKKLNERAARLHMKSIPTEPKEKCVKTILKCLRNNEIVCFITDEDISSGGIFVDFFGKSAATATGPAVFSLRTGAPIVPMFIVNQGNNRNTIIIDPALKFEKTGDKKKDIQTITERFTKVIEDYIRCYPSQWPWVNKRWKTQPKQSTKGNNNERNRRTLCKVDNQ